MVVHRSTLRITLKYSTFSYAQRGTGDGKETRATGLNVHDASYFILDVVLLVMKKL